MTYAYTPIGVYVVTRSHDDGWEWFLCEGDRTKHYYVTSRAGAIAAASHDFEQRMAMGLIPAGEARS